MTETIFRRAPKLFFILILALVFSREVFAETTNGGGGYDAGDSYYGTCEYYKGGKSSPDMKRKLLTELQLSLLKQARMAKHSLRTSKECFDKSDHPYCQQFLNNFYKSMEQQLLAYKIANAINGKLFTSRRHISDKKLLESLRDDDVEPSEIADFDVPGFDFSPNEKRIAGNIWQKQFWALAFKARKLEPRSDAQATNFKKRISLTYADILRTRIYFRNVKNALARMNPMLDYLNSDFRKDDQQVKQAFAKLINHNVDFMNYVKALEVEHPEGFLGLIDIRANDHEMGLVGFDREAQYVLADLPEDERANACASWESLQGQRSDRVATSVGVGLTTAIACSAGLWWGLSTLPALGACSFAVADGAFGSYRGKYDSYFAASSGYAGKRFDKEFKMIGGARDAEEAEALSSRGNIVFAINAIGVFPVLNGVSAASKAGSKGGLIALAKLPASDSAVSLTELSAGDLAEFMLDANQLRRTEVYQLTNHALEEVSQ